VLRLARAKIEDFQAPTRNEAAVIHDLAHAARDVDRFDRTVFDHGVLAHGVDNLADSPAVRTRGACVAGATGEHRERADEGAGSERKRGSSETGHGFSPRESGRW